MKRRAEERERADVRQRVLDRDTGCVMSSARCAGPLDVDEIVSRGRGGSWLDDDNCQVLCRHHHELKHSRIHLASILGLWGEHARRMHVQQELGEHPNITAQAELTTWAFAHFDR